MSVEMMGNTAGTDHAKGRHSEFQPLEIALMGLALFAVHLSTYAYNYLFFHILAEFFSIFIAVTVFIITINTTEVTTNKYMQVVGISYLFIGGLDLLHVLSYKGMPIFIDYDYYAPQLWIASRYLESLSMLGAFAILRSGRKINLLALSVVYAAVTVALALSILVYKTFPVCFVKGQGLTPFKVGSEYAICAILVGALVLLHLRRAYFDQRVLRLLRLSVVLMIGMELCFTLYVSDSMSDAFNEAGHLLKILAFYVIYKAVVVTSLRDPLSLLFRDLKLKEERLQEAQSLARLGRWEWDLASGAWDGSPEVYGFLDLPPGSPLDLDRILNRLQPKDADTLSQVLRDTAQTNTPFDIILHLDQPTGEAKIAELRGEGLSNGQGQLIKLAGTLQDVSISQFSIEKGEAIFWMSRNGRFAYANEAACELLGYQKSDLLMLSAPDLNRGASPGYFPDHFETVKAQGSLQFETELAHRDGSGIPVDIYANYITYAGEEFLISFVRNMSERKRYEQAILRLNDIYAALSHTNQAISHCEDRDSLFKSVCDISVRFGHFRVAWIGLVDEENQTVQVVTAAGDGLDYVDKLRLSIDPSNPLSHGPTGRCVRLGQAQIANTFQTDGTTSPWHAASFAAGLKSAAALPIFNQGRVVGVLGLYSEADGFFTPDLVQLLAEMCSDVSFCLDRFDLIETNRQHENELSAAVERLTISNAELERYTYVASHDLQEPLRNIVSYSQLLDRSLRGRVDEEDLWRLNIVVDAAKRMRDLIDGLQAFARVNAKEAPFATVELGRLCEIAQGNLREAISGCDADIKTLPLPVIVGDQFQLIQLFQHLIGNAIKFRRPEKTPQIVISAERQGEEWEICVADNGIGIAETKQDIFDLFQRLHSSTSYPGSGVGLSICRRVVQRHGGRIWYESNEQGGASFKFTLLSEPSGKANHLDGAEGAAYPAAHG